MNDILSRRLPDFVLLLYILAVAAGTYTGGLWAGVGIGGGIILFVASSLVDKKISRPQSDLTIMAVAFFTVTAFLNLQSSQPALSWHEWGRLLTIFVPLLFLLSAGVKRHADHPKFFIVIPAVLILAGLALAARLYPQETATLPPEMLTKLVKYNRGFSYLVLLSFPIMASLWLSKRRWLLLPFLLLLFIPAGLTESRSSKLALMVGLITIIVASIAPLVVRRLLAAAAIIAPGWSFVAREIFLKYPAILGPIPPSWRARVEIWDYMSYRIQEKPWLGWGLGTSHTLDFLKPHGAAYLFTKVPATHPHNVMTELWVELGLPGLALGIAFAFLTLKLVSEVDRRLVPFALGAWTVAFCFSLIAYDFWTDSLFAAFAMTALAFAILQKQISPRFSGAAPEAAQ